MNKVINFENLELGAKIRVVEDEQGEPLWVAKDVLSDLGYTWGVIESLTFQKNGEGCDPSAPPQEPKKCLF